MIERILLDLDDVLNEFTVHAMRHVGCYMPGGWRDYNPKHGFNIVRAVNDMLRRQAACGVTLCSGFFNHYKHDSFWASITQDVWESVPKSRWFDEIMSFALDWVCEKNVFVVTAPVKNSDGMLSSGCIEGKLRWFAEHVPLSQDQLIIAKSKWALATSGSVLIDDYDKNVHLFRGYGGRAILFPRPWNSLHQLSNCPMTYVESFAGAIA